MKKPAKKVKGPRAPKAGYKRVLFGIARKGDCGFYAGRLERLHEDNCGERIEELPWPIFRPLARPASRRKGAR